MFLLLKYTLLYTVVLMMVALGGMFSERSGIINIALEGIMVIGGLMGVIATQLMPAGSSAFAIVAVSVLAAAIAGMVYAGLLAFASINLNADQTIGGTALNLLATALAMVIAKGVKKATVQPAAFPQIMCVGMIIFTVILLIQSIIKLISMSDDDPLAEPAASINFIKNKGVLAGLFVILLCVLFVAFFDSLGYVVVGMLLCGIIMWLIGKRNIVELLLVSILVPLGRWLVFYKMLSVNIPMGVLQPLRDLVDMIHF